MWFFVKACSSLSDAEHQDWGAVEQEKPPHSWQEQREAQTPTSHTPAHSPIEKQPQRSKDTHWQTANIPTPTLTSTLSFSVFVGVLSLIPSNHKYMQNPDSVLLCDCIWREMVIQWGYSSGTHTNTYSCARLHEGSYQKMFANLKADSCMLDSWLIALLAMNFNTEDRLGWNWHY